MSQFREKCVTENLHKSANFPINLYQTINSPCYYSAPRPFNFLEIVKFVKGTVVAIYVPEVFKFKRTYIMFHKTTQNNKGKQCFRRENLADTSNWSNQQTNIFAPMLSANRKFFTLISWPIFGNYVVNISIAMMRIPFLFLLLSYSDNVNFILAHLWRWPIYGNLTLIYLGRYVNV